MTREQFEDEQNRLRRGLDSKESTPAGSPWTVMPCSHCGARISDAETVFCPKCGERVIDEDTEMVTRRMLALLNANLPTAIRHEVAELERKVIRMEQRLLEQGTRPFSWQQVPDPEKWKLTWGVWGRQILFNIALMVGLFLILAAIAGSFGN